MISRLGQWLAVAGITFAIAGMASQAEAGTVVYKYDNLNQLTAVEYEDGSSISYTYDPAGNWVTMRALTSCLLDVDGSGAPASVSTDIVYIARRLLGFVPVPPSFRAANPSIPPDATIAANIDAALSSFDVDLRGGTQVSTDIVYIARRLLGFVPVPPSFRVADPTIPSDAEIAARIDALCP